MTLSLEDIESAIRPSVISMTGLPSASVLIAYQQGQQPGPEFGSDQVYLWAEQVSDNYDKITYTDYVLKPAVSGQPTLPYDLNTSYSRVVHLHFNCYGPDSYIYADLIRVKILAPDIFASLKALGVVIINRIDPPIRADYPFNGRWWRRTDLTIPCYISSSVTQTVYALATAEIEGYTKDGKIFDYNVTQ